MFLVLMGELEACLVLSCLLNLFNKSWIVDIFLHLNDLSRDGRKRGPLLPSLTISLIRPKKVTAFSPVLPYPKKDVVISGIEFFFEALNFLQKGTNQSSLLSLLL
jgi:hypothetical protein